MTTTRTAVNSVTFYWWSVENKAVSPSDMNKLLVQLLLEQVIHTTVDGKTKGFKHKMYTVHNMYTVDWRWCNDVFVTFEGKREWQMWTPVMLSNHFGLQGWFCITATFLSINTPIHWSSTYLSTANISCCSILPYITRKLTICTVNGNNPHSQSLLWSCWHRPHKQQCYSSIARHIEPYICHIALRHIHGTT